MKKLPICLTIACLLVSVTAWAGWKKPEQNPNTQVPNLISRSNLPICCSADGKIVYVSYITTEGGFGKVILYKSIDGGETWAEQIMSPVLNPYDPSSAAKKTFRPEPTK
jgi:hypothetical protein